MSEDILQELMARALAAGSERVAAWADVLDRINVFPVPDGDTGRNLVFSLSPLRRQDLDSDRLTQELLLASRGNSGNIAGRFFSGFLPCPDINSLPGCCRQGRDLAYRAVPDPKSGTMLTLFDVLTAALEEEAPGNDADWVDRAVEAMAEAVTASTGQLPELTDAGVVDAGALGMFLFFDSCLNTLAGREAVYTSPVDRFKNSLDLSETWTRRSDQGYCLDVVVQVDHEAQTAIQEVYSLGDSLVAVSGGDLLKLHFHTASQEEIRQRLTEFGRIVSWAADDLEEQTLQFPHSRIKPALAIMTDAAGSLTRQDAAQLGVTLLDSYIQLGDQSLPETYVDPARLFTAMREGASAATAQASVMERHHIYSKVLKLHKRVLYLCVGSAYTGNYQVVMDWKQAYDPVDRLTVLDTGAASGRLGLAVRATAEYSLATSDPEAVVSFAREAVRKCEEYVFLDKLKYLARGGRLSKTSAFFGDVLHMKPVITPRPEGAVKAAVLKNSREQVDFAIQKLQSLVSPDRKFPVLLQYTDNRPWLADQVRPEIQCLFPQVEILLKPVSLTSAVHMGPGTWALAFLPPGSDNSG